MQQIIVEYLYNLFSCVEELVMVYIVVRFVLGRMDRTDKPSLRRALAVVIPMVLILSVLTIWNDDFSSLNMLSYCIMFVMLDSKPRIRDIFLCFPIMGLIMGIYMIPMCILHIIYGSIDPVLESTSFIFKNNEINYTVLAVELTFVTIMVVICLTLYRLYKKYPLYFVPGSHKKSTGFYIGMGYGYFVLLCVQMFLDMVYNSRFLIFLVLIVLLIMDMTLIIMLVQEYRVKYFTQTAALNEYYLNSQVEQFRNYRLQQWETRRIRHDMKNHLLMLSQIAENGDLQGIKTYIGGLSEEMQSTASELHTGNDTADAIVNAKHAQAERLGIKIEIDGMLPPELNIAAIDVCTIFANALDNAIEGIPSDCPDERKIISISITNSNSMHMITFRNPTKPNSGRSLTTSKDDKINHGFGMENMRRAAAKYNGQLTHRIEGDSDMCYFVLEAVIFC